MKMFNICTYDEKTNEWTPVIEIKGSNIDEIFDQIDPSVTEEDAELIDCELISCTKNKDEKTHELTINVKLKPHNEDDADPSFIERYKVVEI